MTSSFKRSCQGFPHPLVQFEPGGEAFAVLILEAKEPGFPQPDCLHYLNISIKNMIKLVC